MPEYQILVTTSARKQLKSLLDEVSVRVAAKIDELIRDPRPLGCCKLKGRINRWRIRVGDYRIIYSIDDKNFIVKILEVGHRRDIYK